MVFPTSLQFEVDVKGKKEKRSRGRIRQFPSNSTLNYYNLSIQNYKGDPPLQIKKIAKDVYSLYPKVDEIHYINKNKLKIVTNDLLTANSLLKDEHFANYRIMVPFDDVEIRGVVGIPCEDDDGSILTEEKVYKECSIKHKPEFGLIEGLDEMKIVEVKRFVKYSKNKEQTILNRVLLTFTGKSLPSHIIMDNILFPVMSYREPVLQCFKCYRFNHSTRACNKPEALCRRCGQHHSIPDGSNFPTDCTNEAKCVNCKGNHPSNDKSCPVFQRHKFKNDEKAAREQPKKRPIFSLEQFPILGSRRPSKKNSRLTESNNPKVDSNPIFQRQREDFPKEKETSVSNFDTPSTSKVIAVLPSTLSTTNLPNSSAVATIETNVNLFPDNTDNLNSFSSSDLSGFYPANQDEFYSSMDTSEIAINNKRNRAINLEDSDSSDLQIPLKKNSNGN